METYSEYQSASSSEKVGLVALNAGKRLMGWTLYSGSIYSISFDTQVIISLLQDGTALTAASSLALVTAGKYYLDRPTSTLYLRTSDSSNPNGKFIACTTRFFFSNFPVRQPWDLSTGFSVPWLPMLKSTSQFGVGLDNTNLLGFALEGSGSITLHNDQTFWASKYDKYFFEGQQCYVYSWNRTLPITEAKLIYQGRVESKGYSDNQITISLKDQLAALRSKPTVSLISSLPGVSVPQNIGFARQRLVFGYVYGFRPTNIDQVLELTGYGLTGTVAVTKDSVTVTGTGTSFLSELGPGDQVLIGDFEDAYTIDAIASNTSLTLTEAFFSATASGQALKLKSFDRPKRFANRVFLVAGHELREPSATITQIYSFTTFDVDDSTDFLAGEPIVINSENLVIERVSGNRITLTQAAAFMSAGDTVVIPSIRNVYLNKRLLTYNRDYTYDAETAQITLDSLAEFNVAPVKPISGSMTFTSTGTDIQKRTVTGTSTFFKKELSPGDWIRRATESDWFEILSIESDTSLTLRTVCTYSSTGASYKKNPEVYVEGSSVLSCDVLGMTEDGTKEGVFLNTAPRIVKKLLGLVGLSLYINTDSFDEVDELGTPLLGLAIPQSYSSGTVPTVRDSINLINQSVFGSLYQNKDFELCYSVLSPKRPPSMRTFKKSELLNWALRGESQNITKTVTVEYLDREYDPESGTSSKEKASYDSPDVNYFTDIEREKVITTALVSTVEAERYARRWAFVLGSSNGVLSLKLPMSAARVDVNEVLYIQHEKLCERFGSLLARRIGAVSSLKRDIGRTTVEIDDVGGAFARCAIICETTSNEYSSAPDDEKFVNGYITDSYGLIDNDAELFGINLIW